MAGIAGICAEYVSRGSREGMEGIRMVALQPGFASTRSVLMYECPQFCCFMKKEISGTFLVSDVRHCSTNFCFVFSFQAVDYRGLAWREFCQRQQSDQLQAACSKLAWRSSGSRRMMAGLDVRK